MFCNQVKQGITGSEVSQTPIVYKRQKLLRHDKEKIL